VIRVSFSGRLELGKDLRMSSKIILLVEDDERDIELTLTALEEINLANQVVVAQDGLEALDYLYGRGAFLGRKEGLPVLVLLDIKLPKVDGFEVLRIMKADPEMKRIPVVLFTSSLEEKDIVKSYDSGANGFVEKPITFDGIVEVMKKISLFWILTNETPSPRFPERI
jgi:CheY-like chemotaxis protein